MSEQPHDISRGGQPPSSVEPKTGVVVRIDIPPSNRPGVIRGESLGAETGRAALTGLYDAWGKIQDTAREVQDKGRLAAATQPFAERALASASRGLTTLQQQRAHLDKEIAAAIAPKQSDPYAGEIRGYWRGRSSTTKFLVALEAVPERRPGDHIRRARRAAVSLRAG